MDYDQLLAQAVMFLIDDNKPDVATMLSLATLTEVEHNDDSWNNVTISLVLTGPKQVFDSIRKDNPSYSIVLDAFNAVYNSDYPITYILVIYQASHKITENWRKEILDLLQKREVSNQGLRVLNQGLVWEKLHFGSASEIKCAEALERAGVMFFPNCSARLGTQEHRFNREIDFVVCYNGKWGVIEVDGGPFHPANRAALEGEQDRQLKKQGLKVIERYDSKRFLDIFEASDVIEEFLRLLSQS